MFCSNFSSRYVFVISAHASVSEPAEHLGEINVTQGGFFTEENLKVVKEKFGKYKDLQFPTIKIKNETK